MIILTTDQKLKVEGLTLQKPDNPYTPIIKA